MGIFYLFRLIKDVFDILLDRFCFLVNIFLEFLELILLLVIFFKDRMLLFFWK